MLKWIAMIAAGLMAFPATAEDWRLVTHDIAAGQLYSVNIDGAKPESIFFALISEDERPVNPDLPDSAYIISRYNLDCDKGTISVRSFAVYDDNGDVLLSENMQGKDTTLPILPGSHGALFSKIVCDGEEIPDESRKMPPPLIARQMLLKRN